MTAPCVELINPFVSAAFSVLGMMLGEEPTKGPLTAQPTCFTSDQVNVVLGVTGEIVGVVVLGMSLTTADKIASTMIGSPVKTFDALASSAVGELGNMICGNALRAISDAGHICDLAPPTVIRGTSVQISTVNVPAIVVQLGLTQGTVSLTVSLAGNSMKKAA